MGLQAPWLHTSKSRPCPVCSRAKSGNRCILIPDKVALCYYAISEHRRDTTAGTCWLHFLSDAERRIHRTTSTYYVAAGVDEAAAAEPRRNDLHLLAQKFRSRITPARLRVLGRDLGLSVEALQRLDCGWADAEPMFVASRNKECPINAWSFPRRDAFGAVTGLSMRPQWGRKFTFTGSGGGLHIPAEFVAGGRAFLMEGPTDTAAACDLGLNAFGRTSCASDVGHVLDFVRRHDVQDLVIFSQRDDVKYRPDGAAYWPAQDGAEQLAAQARLDVPRVSVIMPPPCPGDKDVRDWLRRGATGADVEQLVTKSSPRTLSVAVHIRRRKGNGVCQTTKQI